MIRKLMLFGLLAMLLLMPLAVAAQQPVVRAVFFYSPTCPHCEQVIAEDMPPLADQYGDQLLVLYIDVTTQLGQALYQSAIQSLAIPEERLGVPTLVVGDAVLVGSLEIPQQFPSIIERGLAQGGVDWPTIEGLPEVVASIESSNVEAEAVPNESATVLDRIMLDPVGNGLSILVLLAMVVSLLFGIVAWRRPPSAAMATIPAWHSWAELVLIVVGAAVASYLTFIETSTAEAVCGPIGDCVAVNTSQYAWLFGVLPVGLLGLVGYLLVAAAWIVERLSEGRTRQLAQLTMFGLILIGLLFSIYLTFLEPFVIGATCLWCLTSAVIMTVLFLIKLAPARAAYRQLFAR